MPILALCGSTRADSANHRLLGAIRKMLANKVELSFAPRIDELPHFNPDLDNEDLLPPSVMAFRQACAAAPALVICTPEYVFSLPGSLKNALEWLVSTTILQDKPMALITASALGEKAHESLRLIVHTMGGRVPEPAQLLISGVRSKVGSDGAITDGALQQALKNLIDAVLALL